MSKGKRMRRLERRDSYWRGVKNCIQWIGGVLVGGSMFLYYLLEILDRMKLGGA